MSDSVVVRRGGTPSDEEMAAIAAAASVLVLAPAQVAAAPEVSRWRFSGRWWVKPVPLQRRRP